MQIYFHRHLFSHLSRVPILVEGTVYIYFFFFFVLLDQNDDTHYIYTYKIFSF